MRIERGRPRFGADMTEETIPLEAGLEERAISRTKGCYVGQEVIVRVQDRGHGRVARKLVGLTFDAGSNIPAPRRRVQSADREIGRVTSATWSPALARPIALGYVHRDFTEPGTHVSGCGRGRGREGAAARLGARRSRQARDQLVVGWRELQRRQVVTRHPAHLLTEQGPWFAEQPAAEEMQFDAALRIVVRDGEDFFADLRVGVQFLSKLAPQAVGSDSPGSHLPPGKFPVAFEVDTTLTSRDEERAVALDHRGGDDDVTAARFQD